VYPTRRSLLRTGALAGAGLLAGCLTDGGPPGGPDDSGTDSPTSNGSDAGDTRPRGTGGPGITLASVDDPPDLPVRPTVEVVEPVATDDYPPALRLSLRNVSDEPVRVGEGRAVLFAFVTDETDALVLLPAEEEYDAEPGCWRLAEPVAVTEEYRILTVEAGETLSRRVDLYALPGDEPDACLPVGEYRFASRFATTTDPEGVPGETDEDRTATWGFTILLE
jgi:hypothetical protein